MSSVVIAGDTSGSITVSAPAVAGSNTLTLPAATGTVIYADGSGNLQANSGYGSVATGYLCRAWVNFNGTGTVAIRGSGNVTSITDNGVGDYTVNFTTAMPDGNYSSQIYCCDSGTRTFTTYIPSLTYYATSSFRFLTGYVSSITGGLAAGDSNTVSLGIFR